MAPVKLPSFLLAGALALTVPSLAHAGERFGDNFTPRGVQLELMPAASLCMPTAVTRCRGDGGFTGPFVGGQLTVGYRPIRNISIGIAYTGAALRPDWDIARPYAEYAHLHGVFAVARPIFGYRRLDLSVEVGAGWSYLNFDLHETTAADMDTVGGRRYSHGFAALLAPAVDVFLTEWFYLGAKTDFILNVHTKACTALTGLEPECLDRSEDDQIPVHQVLVGIHLGFVI